ncbi:MAG: GNAT family N-acetyltransferase [Anaerolineae bacterium]|nr:GNAT family N-acetyltransferase [Anaerolineae bacterium]
MNITIRPCHDSDLKMLQKIGIETYDETFRAMNEPHIMDQYLAEAFNLARLREELANKSSYFYFLFVDEILAGYLKLNEAPAQSDINDPDALEIERIYVRKAFKGQGLGKYLMNYALDFARFKAKTYAWLGVWEKNSAAIAFYKKMGFVEAGGHSFRMGDEIQSDLVMKKQLD